MNLNKLEKELRDFTSGSHEKVDTNDLWNRVHPHIQKKKRYSWKMPLFLVAILVLLSGVSIWLLPQSDDNVSNYSASSKELTEQSKLSKLYDAEARSKTQNFNQITANETPTTTLNSQSIKSKKFQNPSNTNQDINSTITNSPISNQTITNTPTTSQTIPNNLSTNSPTTNQLKINQPITNQPTTIQPISYTPITKTPITKTPITNQQITKTPITNKPITNTPITNTPINTQKINNQTITNTPITNTPINTQTINNQTITNTPITNTPITNTPITNQPIPNQPINQSPINNQQLTKINISTIPLVATLLDAGESELSQYPKRISPYMRRQFPKLTLEIGGSYLAPQKELILQNDEFANEFASRDLAEEVLEGWYATANVRYHMTPNWGISVGVQYGAINERSSTTLTNSETVFLENTIVGNLVRVDGSIDPIYGDIEIDRTVTKQVSRINSYSFLQLPIELMYKLPVNRLNLEFGVGAIQSIQFSSTGFWHPDAQTEYDLSTDSKGYLKSRLGLGLTGRVGVGYDLTPSVGVYAHGRYIKYMSGITSTNYGIDQKYAALGAEVGIRFHLFN